MSTVTSSDAKANHAELYKKADNPSERKRLQTLVILAHRDKVAGVARSMLPKKHWREGEHVGALGVLMALDRFDPDKGPFDRFVGYWIRKEIRDWARISTSRPKYSPRTTEVLDIDSEEIEGEYQTPEELFSDAQLDRRVEKDLPAVREYLNGLSDYSRALLLKDRRRKIDLHTTHGREYQSLVSRAREHLGANVNVNGHVNGNRG